MDLGLRLALLGFQPGPDQEPKKGWEVSDSCSGERLYNDFQLEPPLLSVAFQSLHPGEAKDGAGTFSFSGFKTLSQLLPLFKLSFYTTHICADLLEEVREGIQRR